jgi:hypothetical protein
MKRIKQLIEDHKKCWYLRKKHCIKWRAVCIHNKMPACTFYLLPTIAYNTYPYRRPGWYVFEVCFLHWYIYIGAWCNKEADMNAESQGI